jgi:hypothetical protein
VWHLCVDHRYTSVEFSICTFPEISFEASISTTESIQACVRASLRRQAVTPFAISSHPKSMYSYGTSSYSPRTALFVPPTIPTASETSGSGRLTDCKAIHACICPRHELLQLNISLRTMQHGVFLMSRVALQLWPPVRS